MGKKKYDWGEIQKFYDTGKTLAEISRTYGPASSSIDKAIKTGKFISRPRRILDINIIQKLLDNGLDVQEVSKLENCSVTAIYDHIKSGVIVYDVIDVKAKRDLSEIQEYYYEGNSLRDCVVKFNISMQTLGKATREGRFITRNLCDAMKIAVPKYPRKMSDAAKKKMSENMKKRHAAGTAHCLGSNRWWSEPSYPEKFFMKIIARDFEDKNYLTEMPFFRYSLDFVWLEKHRVIEIDGEQHYRFQKQIDSDIRKDALLREHGWDLLRIRWKDMYHDKQRWIDIADEFVHKPVDIENGLS
jgi:very-short-patch-repair endonuclease